MPHQLTRCLTLIVVLIFCTCCRQDSNAGAPPFTVLWWNLEWFPGHKPGKVEPEEAQAHFDAVFRELKEQQPDVLLLSEIKTENDAQRLAGALGMRLDLFTHFKGAQEIAILSRHGAEAVHFEEFVTSRDGTTPPRGLVFGAFRHGRRLVLAYGCHLKSNRGGSLPDNITKREEAARQMIAHIQRSLMQEFRDSGPVAVVVAGDFNTDPFQADFRSERTLAIFREAGFSEPLATLPAESRWTWRSDGRFPNACFDHAFTSGATVSAAVLPTSEAASDHRPVSVMLQ